MSDVLNRVCAVFGVEPTEVRNVMVHRANVVDARHATVLLLMDLYGCSASEAAQIVNAHRTISVFARNRHAKRCHQGTPAARVYRARYEEALRIERQLAPSIETDANDIGAGFIRYSGDLADRVRQFAYEQHSSINEALTYLLHRAFADIEKKKHERQNQEG